MRIPPIYPGVYIEEIPNGRNHIKGVPTSVTAFIGRTKKGPVNEVIEIRSFSEFNRIFGGLWMKSTVSFAVRDFFLNGGSHALVVRLIKGASGALIKVPTGSRGKMLLLETSSPGAWGNRVRVAVDHQTKDPADLELFNLEIAGPDRQLEKHANVSVNASSPRYLPKVLQSASRLLRVSMENGVYSCPGIRPVVTGTPIAASDPDKGSDGADLTIEQFTTGKGLKNSKQGLWALERADIFNLLCLPPYSFLTDIETDLIKEATKYCEDKRAILIIDPPAGWTNAGQVHANMVSGNPYPGTDSGNATIYFPRIQQLNPLRRNRIEEFVPCGAVAGVMARTDANRGVWKAPAGVEAKLNGVQQLASLLTDAENSNINQLGVNCLRYFPNAGFVVWGARTLAGANQGASEWKYLPVRRTALFIEESLTRGLQWVVFEPNNETLWAKIRLQVENFLYELFRKGAFQGAMPKDSYFVKCGLENITQTDIEQGIVNITLGFAPLKPAEFVILQLKFKAMAS